MQVVVRAEVSGDEEPIRQVHQEAFPSALEAEIVDRLRQDPNAFIPNLSLVALVDDRIVGHCILSKGRLEGARVATLGPIGVLPEMQRRGIGSRLMRHSIEISRAMRIDAIVLIGHPEYYPRFGFMPASRLGLSVAYGVPDEVAMALKLHDRPMPATGLVLYPKAYS